MVKCPNLNLKAIQGDCIPYPQKTWDNLSNGKGWVVLWCFKTGVGAKINRTEADERVLSFHKALFMAGYMVCLTSG